MFYILLVVVHVSTISVDSVLMNLENWGFSDFSFKWMFITCWMAYGYLFLNIMGTFVLVLYNLYKYHRYEYHRDWKHLVFFYLLWNLTIIYYFL